MKFKNIRFCTVGNELLPLNIENVLQNVDHP